MALIAEVACGAAKGAQTVVMLTTSSGTALARHLARAGLPPDTRTEHLLARHDPQAQGVLDAWAGPLRQAIDSLITLCNPQLVVIGGGAGAAAVAAMARRPEPKSWFHAPVVAAMLGDDAGVIGAALAGLPGQLQRIPKSAKRFLE